MKHVCIYCLAMVSALMLLMTSSVQAQMLDYQNKITVSLEDGTKVILYGRASNDKAPGTDTYKMTGEYFYLPVNMRLALRPDSVPEFLLLKYTTEERADAGGVQGALLHFLMQWGLTPAQEVDLATKVKAKVAQMAATSPLFAQIKDPTIAGAVDLSAEKEGSFTVTSGILNDKSMVPSMITSGKAPLIEGGKVAVASRLDQHGAQLLTATLDENRSISDVSLSMNFGYSVLFPAVRGKITVDWTKFQTAYENFSAKYSHKTNGKGGDDDTYAYDEVKAIYNSAIESKAVTIEIDKNTTDDAVANKVVEEFMNVMMAAITERSETADKPAAPTEAEKAADPNIRVGAKYRFSRTKFQSRYDRKIEVYNLNYRIAIPQTISITENLSHWYDGVRHNAKCVSAVNLNDKFFQHRDVNMVLSEATEQLIGKEVNYVTINVRKQRPNGNSFLKSITIDRDYIKKNGIRASLTYARDADDADVYEYQSLWSFKDGEIFPANADWIKGTWEALPLVAPLRPRTIELEGDPAELKAAGITRATLQLRYWKLGKEIETNIPLSVTKNENIVKVTVFTDPDTRGYAYRLVFNHKDAGKLVPQDWDAKINDDYVYITIPESLKDPTTELFQKAAAVGKVMTETPDGKVNSASSILDKFKSVIGIVAH